MGPFRLAPGPEGSHVNKSSETDARGLTTTYEYDALNRETRRVVHVENGYETVTAYDPAGRSFTTRDPLGTLTLHRTDGLEREVERVVDPEGLALRTSSVYDGFGRPRQVTDARYVSSRMRHGRS